MLNILTSFLSHLLSIIYDCNWFQNFPRKHTLKSIEVDFSVCLKWWIYLYGFLWFLYCIVTCITTCFKLLFVPASYGLHLRCFAKEMMKKSREVHFNILKTYFHDAYDVNLWEKNFGRSTAYSSRTNVFLE